MVVSNVVILVYNIGKVGFLVPKYVQNNNKYHVIMTHLYVIGYTLQGDSFVVNIDIGDHKVWKIQSLRIPPVAPTEG